MVHDLRHALGSVSPGDLFPAMRDQLGTVRGEKLMQHAFSLRRRLHGNLYAGAHD
jgi:hypothetical protein